MDTPRTDTTANGAQQRAETVWTDPVSRQRVFVAGEVATSSTTVLQMPQQSRFVYWWHEMVRQAARTLGVNSDSSSKLRWVPLCSLIVGLVMSVGAVIMAYGVYRGRSEVKEETITANQRATADLINASEARLTKATDELRAIAHDMQSELNTKVDAIDGKVESIRGSVASQQAQLAELRARLEAANEDRSRLWQSLATQDLKLQRMERERLGITPLSPPSSVNPQQPQH